MKTAIFIIGMGRSGTSVLSRLLSLCGATLPKDLIAANANNPSGYWEPEEALDLNERFLKANGSSWFDPSPTLSIDLDPMAAEAEAFAAEAQALLRSWTCDGALVIKEPRITILAPLWFEAARREGFAIKIIIPVRDPVEIGMSLQAAGALPPEHAALLTLKYHLLAERFSRGLPRVFVSYSRLLEDWQHEIGRINLALGTDLAPISVEAIGAFLTPSLHRQHHPDAATDAIAPPALAAVHDGFTAAATDIPLDLVTMDAIFADYIGYAQVWPIAEEVFLMNFKPNEPLAQLIARQEQRAKDLEKRLAEREAVVAVHAATIKKLRLTVEQFTSEQ